MSTFEKVEVHYFTAYDGTTDSTVIPLNNGRRSKRTAAFIRDKIPGGKIVPGTSEIINESSLDEHERYYPPNDK